MDELHVLTLSDSSGAEEHSSLEAAFPFPSVAYPLASSWEGAFPLALVPSAAVAPRRAYRESSLVWQAFPL